MTEFAYLFELFNKLWNQSDGITDHNFARKIYVKIEEEDEKVLHL